MSTTYASKAEVLTFLQKMNPSAVLADIEDMQLYSTKEMIDERTNSQWTVDTEDKTVYVDGNDLDTIFSNISPITSLTSVKIIKQDLTEEVLDFSGSDRNAYYDLETGMIQYVRPDSTRIEVTGGDFFYNFGLYFPYGVRNVEITGKFGRETPYLIKMIQIFEIAKQMTIFQPSKYKADVLEEKIGRYTYKMGLHSKGHKGIDAYIDYLYSCLPKDDQLGIEAI